MRTLSLAALLAALVATMQSAPTGPPASAPMDTSPSVALDDAPSPQDVARDTRSARAALERLSGEYRLLDGVTVTVGHTPGGEQAVAYYTEGQIVIDRAHSASIDEILEHEIWHVIDWRDNGQLDWGEDLPPNNAASYAKR